MKVLSSELKSHLQSGTTTLASCWILKRTDGYTLGFTDHDEPLLVNGTPCEPATGMTGSETRQSEGFASDDQDISGIISSDKISEVDMMSGRYDGATVETWRVNWQDVDQKLLLRTGYLGEIRRTGETFQTEIRGLSVALEQERGRIYQYSCDAVFGDSRCGIDLARPDLSFEGSIVEIASPTELVVSFATAPPSGRLALGQLCVLSGQASSMTFDVLNHHRDGAGDRLEMWLPCHGEIAVGDVVRVYVGCNKCFATCRDVFANQVNYRGFPHIPGNDFVLSSPEQHKVKDGSSLMEE